MRLVFPAMNETQQPLNKKCNNIGSKNASHMDIIISLVVKVSNKKGEEGEDSAVAVGAVRGEE